MDSINRNTILNVIRKKLEVDLTSLSLSIRDLQDANTDNSKSTAGDKHDTERAMLHSELERLSGRLTALKRTLSEIENIIQIVPSKDVSYGSLVFTNRGVFLIGVALGKTESNDLTIFGLSMLSPLAGSLQNQRIGGMIELNGNQYRILDIR